MVRVRVVQKTKVGGYLSMLEEFRTGPACHFVSEIEQISLAQKCRSTSGGQEERRGGSSRIPIKPSSSPIPAIRNDQGERMEGQLGKNNGYCNDR